MMDLSKKKAVLLVNLGSPDSTGVPDVRRYLAEFLMDPCVIDSPWPIRFAVVYGAILPKRPQESAKAYQKIWTDQGSPLIAISKQLQNKLQEKVPYPVFLAMRYGNPSIETILKKIRVDQPEIEELFVIPLYPQFAMSSYETVLKKVQKEAKIHIPNTILTIMPPFYNDTHYLKAMEDVIRPYLQSDHDHILFSYHGIPERHLLKSDVTGCHCLSSKNCCTTPSPAHKQCYKAQCIETTHELTRRLAIPANRYGISFQSRLGKSPWIRPYTDEVLTQLPKQGVKNLLVLCPAFVSDCLETLEEIEKEGKKQFLQAGGESFKMIPCLNIHPSWIEALATWCHDTLGAV